jgi:esterase
VHRRGSSHPWIRDTFPQKKGHLILHASEIGEAPNPPLVILHGLFGSGENWRSIARLLADQFHVIVLDLRNHGQSGHAAEMSYEQLATDVAQTLEAMEISSASVLGHSMGGKTAMHLALHHPALVQRLIVVDIAPRAYRPGHLHIIEGMSNLDLQQVRSRKEALQQLEKNIPDRRILLFLIKNLVQENAGHRWKVNLNGIRDNYALIIGGIESFDPYEGPVLFIRGSESDYVSDTDLETARAYFPDADFVTLEGGHWIHVDDPEGFVEAVRTFVSQTESV